VYYFKILYFLGLHDPAAYKKPKTATEREKEYCLQKKERFRTFSQNTKKNENISKLFYDKKAYDEYMQYQNTDIEKKWKSKLMLENTPRGNILMYYDAYKMGFAYVSDQNGISYEILNACAMKYVQMFFCYDFFIDEIVHSELSTSALAEIMSHYTPLKLTHSLSANLKNKNENIRNKFLYLGKMSTGNFQILQPIHTDVKKKSLPLFQSALLENMGSDSNRMSYKDFKNKKDL